MQKKKIYLTMFVALIITVNVVMVTQNVNSYAPPTNHTFTCDGYVKNSSGTPLKRAKVVIQAGDPDTGLYKTVYTDNNGYYYASVQTNLYVTGSISASKSGYYAQSKSVYTKGANRIDFSLSPLPHYFICKGYVKNELGVIQKGATVKVVGTGIDKTVTTDNNGYYYLSVYTTRYVYCQITASESGYDSYSKTVYSSSTNYIHFSLQFTYTMKTQTDTILLYQDEYIWFNYRDYNLKVTTTYYEDSFGGGYISSQSLYLSTKTAGLWPPNVIPFTVAYNDGSASYWKAYSPNVYDNSYMRISASSTTDSDSFSGLSGEFGQQNTILRIHIYCTLNGKYKDLGYKTHEFIF